MGQHWHDGYSATVEAYLVIGDSRFDVAQVAGGFLILRSPQEIPAGTHAELVISIDNELKKQSVVLGDGASIPQHFVSYR
jgi:hypothetical protein